MYILPWFNICTKLYKIQNMQFFIIKMTYNTERLPTLCQK